MKTKSINNLNTLNALIKDESMASKEYHDLAMRDDVSPSLRKVLLEMSRDEMRHYNNLLNHKLSMRK